MRVKVKLLIYICLLFCFSVQAATVDTLTIHSKSMNKNIKAAVVMPAVYTSGKPLQVLYLLHGFSDSFNAWLTKPLPDKQLLNKMADTYHLLIVCPDGGYGSWYLDSPLKKEFQYETFIIQELIPQIDKKYKTIAGREGRLISGLSMGGHGALYLAARNPDKFLAAGSIAGAVDLEAIARERGGDIEKWLTNLLGDVNQQQDRYKAHSVIHLTGKLKDAGLKLIIDCGTSDFLFEHNKALHQKLLQEGIAHHYIERPGEHNWQYFADALEYHLVFFKKSLARPSQ
jgi:S-formylglutathione hydrolase FrmB